MAGAPESLQAGSSYASVTLTFLPLKAGWKPDMSRLGKPRRPCGRAIGSRQSLARTAGCKSGQLTDITIPTNDSGCCRESRHTLSKAVGEADIPRLNVCRLESPRKFLRRARWLLNELCIKLPGPCGAPGGINISVICRNLPLAGLFIFDLRLPYGNFHIGCPNSGRGPDLGVRHDFGERSRTRR
jgi:hypothetical protein